MVLRVTKLLVLVIFLFSMPFALADYNSYPKVAQMEKHLYQMSYDSEDIYSRLARIETSLYKSVQSHKSLADRVDGIANQLHITSMPGYLLDDITFLERTNFNKIYSNDSPDNRLERLEYHLAGALQEGSYTDRVFKLKNLSNRNNINQYFNAEDSFAQNNKDYYYQQEDMNGWQKTLMMLAPILMGIL